MKSKCEHGRLLPKGLICADGYLSVRAAGIAPRGAGFHTEEAEEAAIILLNRIRENQYIGKAGLPQRAERMKFKDASAIYLQRHFVEYKHPKTNKPRTAQSIRTTTSQLQLLGVVFNNSYIDSITVQRLREYRNTHITAGNSHGTLNRHMALLSSMYACLRRWNAEGSMEPLVLLPDTNPCELLPDLEEKRRERVASLEELKAIKRACISLNDMLLWQVIEIALVTGLRFSDIKQLHSPVESIVANADGPTVVQNKTGVSLHLPEEYRVELGLAFVNWQKRWRAMIKATGINNLQFRDLRKTALRMRESITKKQFDEWFPMSTEEEMAFTPKQISDMAGHTSEKTTRVWYLENNTAKRNKPLLDVGKKIMENI